MWEFNRGNPKDLKGTASIYVHNHKQPNRDSNKQGDRRHIEYPVFRVAQRIEDIILSKKNSSWDYENMEKEIEIMEIKINEFMKKEMIIKGIQFAVDDPTELLKLSGDIIFAGDVQNRHIGYSLLIDANSMYWTDYIYQQSQKNSKSKEKKLEPRVPIINTRILDEKGLIRTIMSLTVDLYNKRELGQTAEEKVAIRQILELSKGMRFNHQVVSLIDTFESNHPRRSEIMDAYIHMIGYIHAEKYEEAAALKSKIDALIKSA
jgi:hypothetical protein